MTAICGTYDTRILVGDLDLLHLTSQANVSATLSANIQVRDAVSIWPAELLTVRTRQSRRKAD
jgi:hypothetical protein